MNDVVADRMALIAEVAERTKEARALKVKKSRQRKRLKEEGKMFQMRLSTARGPERSVKKKEKGEENINHWTDGNKYANEFYGETMRETQKWDNEWGDY